LFENTKILPAQTAFRQGGSTARMWAQQPQNTAHQYNKNRNIPGKENTIFNIQAQMFHEKKEFMIY
jgi:hypothetical protein